MTPGIITLTGPSCSGKTTLMQHLVEKAPDVFQVLRSYTSRTPRPGERNGVEYDFITDAEAADYLLKDEVIQRVNFEGCEYGTHVSQLEELSASGRIGITVVEPTGVGQFRSVCSAKGIAYTSFYVDNHPEVLINRWLDRLRLEMQSDSFEWRMNTFDKTRKRLMKTLNDEMDWDEAAKYTVKIPKYDESCVNSVEGLIMDYGLKMLRNAKEKTA